jgi:hypothetical protein
MNVHMLRPKRYSVSSNLECDRHGLVFGLVAAKRLAAEYSPLLQHVDRNVRKISPVQW